MMKKKILVIIGKMQAGGVESFVTSRYPQLADKYLFTYAVFDNSSYIPSILYQSGEVVKIPTPKHFFKFKKELRTLISKQKFDVIHSHINTLNVFPLKIGAQANIPIRICHNHSTTSLKEPLRNLIKIILKNKSKKYATHLAACSYYAGKWMYGKNNFEIIYNSIELNKFIFDINNRRSIRQKLNISNDSILVGHIGRFCTTKNQGFILKLARYLPKYEFLLIGSGDIKKHNKYIDRYGMKNVRIINEPVDSSEYYSAFDIFILPSLYEGLGITLIEAQENGLPIIASSCICAEANVTKTIEYLPLELSKWIDKLKSPIKRKFINLELLEQNYDLKKQNSIEEYYKKIIK